MNAGGAITETVGIVMPAMLFGAPLALVLSLVLMSRYRSAVVREMKRTRGANARPMPWRMGISGGVAKRTYPQAPVQTSWAQQRRRAISRYAVAGLCFALTASTLTFVLEHFEFFPFRALLVTWPHVWPLVLLLTRDFALSRKQALAWMAAYLVVLSIPACLANPWYAPFAYWALSQGPVTLLIAGFLWHRIRAVGPLSLAFALGLVFGGKAALLPLWQHLPEAIKMASALEWFGLAPNVSYVVVMGAVILAGMALAGLVAFIGIAWIGSLYRSGRLGEQELRAHALFLIFCLHFALGAMFIRREARDFVLGLLPFASYGFAAWLLRGRRTASSHAPARLLFLRVFADPAQASRLWEALDRCWRYAGSVTMIGGPDLAASTLAPHRFLDYLGGKLRNRFVHDWSSLTQAIAALEEHTNCDGNEAVHELYCNDDMWRAAFLELAKSSSAVLMDLRGLTRGRAGALYELTVLAASGALGKTLLIVDAATDERLVADILFQARAGAWPRRLAAGSGRIDARLLIEALVETVAWRPVGASELAPAG